MLGKHFAHRSHQGAHVTLVESTNTANTEAIRVRELAGVYDEATLSKSTVKPGKVELGRVWEQVRRDDDTLSRRWAHIELRQGRDRW